MKLIGQGKDKIVFLVDKKDKRPIVQTDSNLIFSVFRSDITKMTKEDVELLLKEQKKQMMFLLKTREKYLISPIEIGIYDEKNRKLYPIMTLFKNKETFAITKILKLEFETAKIYQIYPYVYGDTFNKIIDAGKMSPLIEKSLAQTLTSFFQNYAHYDLTGTNLMYGTINPNKKNKKWYIIDNGQVVKTTRNTSLRKTMKNFVPKRKSLKNTSIIKVLYTMPLKHPDRNNVNILVDEIKTNGSKPLESLVNPKKYENSEQKEPEIIDLT